MGFEGGCECGACRYTFKTTSPELLIVCQSVLRSAERSRTKDAFRLYELSAT
jgi:hypothetical protein